MLKKLLASMMSIIMVLTVMMALPVAAENTLPANIGTDYEPGAVTGNLITNTNPSSSAAQVNNYSNKNNAAYCVQLEGETAAMVSVEATNYQPYTGIAGSVMYTAKRTVPNPWIVYDTTGEYATVSETEHQYLYPLNGTVIQNIAYPDDMPTDGNMVFSVKVNNKSNTEGAKIVAARTKTNTGETSPDHFQYPMEYPNTTDGMVITATGNDTQLFACTFADTEIQTTKQFGYSLGLPEGTAAGTVVRAVSDLYLGLEYAYDIKVTADDTALSFGKSINVDADVLNQGLLPGGLSQEVTWYALNSDRNAAVSGISITEGENGTATVTADNTVETGTYYIVAVADTDEKLVEGIPVTVTKKSYADYEPGAPTGNLFTTTSPSSGIAQANGYSNKNDSNWCVQLEGETAAMVSVETTNYQPHTGIAGSVMYTAKRTVPNPWIKYDTTGEYAVVAEGQNQYMYPLNGTVQMSGSIAYPDDMPTDGNMVFSVRVNNKSNTEGAKIVAARTKTNTGETSPSHFQYPMEYPNTTDGMVITATGNDTQLFACTFADTEVQTTKQFVYSLGLPEGTAAGTVVRAVSDLYLGLEYAYDVKVTADKTSIFGDETVIVDADVLNQGLLPGGIEQGVTWYAMNDDRTAFVDGITITENADGTATVSADRTVAAGTYDIVAVADVDEKLVKGVSIEVINYADYEADEQNRYNDNIVTPGEGRVVGYGWGEPVPTFGFNGAGGTGSMAFGEQGSEYYLINKLADVASATASGNPVVGFNIHTTIPEGATGNVVYSIKMRATTSPKAVINFARINTGISGSSPNYFEYATESGFVPTPSAKIYTGTFADRGVQASKYVYRFGFVDGTEVEAAAFFDASSVYIGYEYAYDISVTADKESVAAGETLTVDADVLNQIDEIGGINQGVTWYAMNADRTAFIDGFTFTEGENGTATVNVASTVPVGNYDIVAISDVDGKLIKGVTVEVTEEESIKGITITKGTNIIAVSTAKALSNAQLIFVKYEGGKMASVNIDTKVNLDAQGTQAYIIPAGYENAKVMLWSADFKPLADLLN